MPYLVTYIFAYTTTFGYLYQYLPEWTKYPFGWLYLIAWTMYIIKLPRPTSLGSSGANGDGGTAEAPPRHN